MDQPLLKGIYVEEAKELEFNILRRAAPPSSLLQLSNLLRTHQIQ